MIMLKSRDEAAFVRRKIVMSRGWPRTAPAHVGRLAADACATYGRAADVPLNLAAENMTECHLLGQFHCGETTAFEQELI
jgi:hypothetical protein